MSFLGYTNLLSLLRMSKEVDTSIEHTKVYKFLKLVLDDLRDLGLHMVFKNQDDFKKTDGNLISLLNTKVDTKVVQTLIQFYDSPLRCFTF